MAWQMQTSTGNDGVKQFFKVDGDEMCRISASVAVHLDGTWTAYMLATEIPSSNQLLEQSPQPITETSSLQALICTIDRASLCPGNSDEKYVSVCKKRKGEKICGERGFGETIGYLDTRETQGT